MPLQKSSHTNSSCNYWNIQWRILGAGNQVTLNWFCHDHHCCMWLNCLISSTFVSIHSAYDDKQPSETKRLLLAIVFGTMFGYQIGASSFPSRLTTRVRTSWVFLELIQSHIDSSPFMKARSRCEIVSLVNRDSICAEMI